MKKLLIAALLVIAFPQAAPAADMALDDFAYGLSLMVDQEAPIYEVELPQSVYETVTRPDLGDIRVFNREGELVPHAVQATREGASLPAETVSLPFFPLFGEETGAAQPLSMHVITDKDGVIVDVKTGRGGRGEANVNAYILDGSKLDRRPDRLEVAWRCDCDNLVIKVDVDTSRDLNRWSRLVSRTTLADLNYGGQRLQKHTINLPPSGGRYFRLSWPGGEKGAVITRVRASFPTSRQGPPRRWKTLAAVRSEEKSDGYLFDTDGYFPVDRLKIQPPQRNTWAKVALLSRSRPENDWRKIYSGSIYNLELEGARLRNDEVYLPANRDRFYLLEVDPGGGGLGAGLPALEISWTQQKLYFVARGQGPYTLAYGNAAAEPGAAPMDPLLKDINHRKETRFIKPARIGPPLELGGPMRLKKPKPPPPWKTYILWTVLVAGVLLLGVMAWRLYRQMNEPEKTDA